MITKNKFMNPVEGNKIIAKFMGWKYNPGYKAYELKENNERIDMIGLPIVETDFKYHTSWDWLMPVVEKIESIENSDDYEVDIFSNCCEIGCKDEHSAVGKTKIEAVWQAVIQFILWYNQNNK